MYLTRKQFLLTLKQFWHILSANFLFADCTGYWETRLGKGPEVRRNIPFQVLAVRRMGRCRHRRLSSHPTREINLHALQIKKRILVSSLGESVCKVSSSSFIFQFAVHFFPQKSKFCYSIKSLLENLKLYIQ